MRRYSPSPDRRSCGLYCSRRDTGVSGDICACRVRTHHTFRAVQVRSVHGVCASCWRRKSKAIVRHGYARCPLRGHPPVGGRCLARRLDADALVSFLTAPRVASLAGTRFCGCGGSLRFPSLSRLRRDARDARIFLGCASKNPHCSPHKSGCPRAKCRSGGGLRPPHRIAALGGGYSVRRPPVHTLRVRRSACTEFRCGPPWLSRPRRAKKSAAPGALSRGRSCRFFVGRGAKVAARAATRRPQKIAMKPRFFEAAGLGTEVWRVGSGGIAGLSPAPCAGRFAPDAFRWPRPALGCRMPEPTPLSPAPLASARFAGLAASGCRISKACRVQKSRYPPAGFRMPGGRAARRFFSHRHDGFWKS